MAQKSRILIIVQNLPVPLDRRVWLECQALVAAGYSVSVICPRGPADTAYEALDGVHIHRYRAPAGGDGVAGYLTEFVVCWIRTALLSVRVWRRHGFDIIQACNPPDTYWLLAWLWRPRGVRFVYDQHDLNPELFLSRFGKPSSLFARAQLAVLSWLERRTYRRADRVISANDSYRSIAIRRAGCIPEHVSVVRSGPDTARMRPVHPDVSLRPHGRHVLAYLGIMGPQDGVDYLIDALDVLIHKLGRTDAHAVLMGFGDSLAALRRQVTDLGLDDYVTFTGRVGPDEIAQYLSVASIGLGPDQKTPLNDLSTMNKTMEYMAYALPVVTFDLAETRVTAADCAVYVQSGDVEGFAAAIDRLLDDPAARRAMGRAARARCQSVLDWKEQARTYVSVYDGLTTTPAPGQSVPRPDPGTAGPGLDRAPDEGYVDLTDDDDYDAFLALRDGTALDGGWNGRGPGSAPSAGATALVVEGETQ